MPLATARAIPLALAGGVFLVTGGALYLRTSGAMEPNPELARILPLVVAVLALSLVPVYVVVRRVLVVRARGRRAQGLEEVQAGRIPAELFALTLAGAALAESLGLVGALALLLGGSWLVLAAPILAVVLVLLQLPSRERLENLLRAE
jgi:hypothetical protein